MDGSEPALVRCVYVLPPRVYHCRYHWARSAERGPRAGTRAERCEDWRRRATSAGGMLGACRVLVKCCPALLMDYVLIIIGRDDKTSRSTYLHARMKISSRPKSSGDKKRPCAAEGGGACAASQPLRGAQLGLLELVRGRVVGSDAQEQGDRRHGQDQREEPLG